MKIATWNVNSVKARLPHLLAYLEEAQPDVLCLQEIKCLSEDFPALEVKGLGYHVEALGQKTYNGVALISRKPAENVLRGLAGDESDTQARYIEGTFDGLVKANELRRAPAPISKLTIGLKCGGSDGFSGLSANPTLGRDEYANGLLPMCAKPNTRTPSA